MNQLKHENSIYLLQHADNPIEWYPWGEKALQKAKVEDKPIFLSIGYAACHWCHVMEKETFMSHTVADYMNRNFVSIKVDREERPDLDKIYMDSVMALTGQGGWPLSVFLTPNGYPFYGGTYFPPNPRYGIPSFMQVVSSIHENWVSNRTAMIEQAKTVTNHLLQITERPSHTPIISPQITTQAIDQIINQADAEYGGWGTHPKFPHPIVLDFLLMQTAQPETKKTIQNSLNHMVQGGMYDLTRGGFHRYSTDQVWRVPHFEKMLYDNAQITKNYLTAGICYQNTQYLAVAKNTLDFMKNELINPSGLFWSSIDADSDGEEGKYYIWDKETITKKIIQAELMAKDFEIISENQLNGKSVVRFNSPDPNDQIHEINHPLYNSLRSIQTQRKRPITDDKILTDWNALTIQAFAYASWILDRPDYKNIAIHTANQLLTKQIVDNRLRHSSRRASVGKPSFLTDYTHLINALIDIFYLEKDKKWFLIAKDLTEEMIRLFYTEPIFYDTPQDKTLIIRPKTLEDNVIPSGYSAAIFALIKMNLIDQNPNYSNIIETAFNNNLEFIRLYPLAAGNWLQAISQWMAPPKQLIVVLPKNTQLEKNTLQDLKTVLPYLGQLLIGTKSIFDNLDLDLFRSKDSINDQTTFYLCRNHTCSLPTNSVEHIFTELEIAIN